MSLKTIFILILIFLLSASIYRIFDLGVSLTYLQSELEQTQKQVDIVRTYQRSPCVVVEKIPGKFSAFKKGDFIFINGLAFECKMDMKSNQKLFNYVKEKN